MPKRKQSFKSQYIFQRRNYYSYQCGPFAVYNLLTTMNHCIDLHDLIEMCDANSKDGTVYNKFNNAINKVNNIYNINIKEVEPTIQNINSMILKNSLIILFHWVDENTKTDGEHYAMIESIDKNKKFKIINYSFDEHIKYLSYREIKTMLLPYKKDNEEYPKLWYCCN